MASAAAKRRTRATKRFMPTRYRWLDLPGPSDREIEVAKEQGEDPYDFTGWKIEGNVALRLGGLTKVMRGLTEAGRMEDLERDPTTEEVSTMATGYSQLLQLLGKSVRAWNFGDEDGNDLEYTPDAWDEIPTELVMRCFRALQMGVGTAPKANSPTPGR